MAIFRKKEVCPTCSGEKCIVCCSCTVDDDCHTLVCPTCHGKGEIVSYNMPAIVIAVIALIAAVVGGIIVFF